MTLRHALRAKKTKNKTKCNSTIKTYPRDATRHLQSSSSFKPFVLLEHASFLARGTIHQWDLFFMPKPSHVCSTRSCSSNWESLFKKALEGDCWRRPVKTPLPRFSSIRALAEHRRAHIYFTVLICWFGLEVLPNRRAWTGGQVPLQILIMLSPQPSGKAFGAVDAAEAHSSRPETLLCDASSPHSHQTRKLLLLPSHSR